MQKQDWFTKATSNSFKYGMLLFIAPTIVVGFSWLGGLIVSWLFGNMIADALNVLFGTVRFSKDNIPEICAALALIGGYFHYKIESKPVTLKKDDKKEEKK